ncbi:DUF6192 family protein, partial [Streptomyces rimosus]|uniref:DUF6192 family protein n=1 Tax=Streptomyces rimosus TaxID=1927 RepID=UPI001F369F07
EPDGHSLGATEGKHRSATSGPPGPPNNLRSTDELFTVAGSLGRFAEDIGVARSTVEDWRWIASRWPKSRRREETVPFGVHRILASLSEEKERWAAIDAPPRSTSGPGPAAGRTSFKSTFDSKTREFVEIFQEFSQLYGKGDASYGVGEYDTWSQLLVSMGNADRAASGSDTRFEITPARGRWLYDNGYRLVGRYLYDPPGSTLDKEIKPGKLQKIFDAKLRVFPIYQDNARRLADFTYPQGCQHALNAHDLATKYGFNRGTTIYFAVDYDAQQGEMESYPEGIVPYFNGVVAGLASRGKKYFHGVYGSRNVCINVTAKTGARFSFVSGMSWGFSGNLGYPLPANWAINQIKEFKVTNGSDAFDLDRDVWRRETEPGVGSVNNTGGPADGYIAYVQRLYDHATAYKSSNGVGTNASRLVMEYIRHEKYRGLKWWWLADSYDEDFVKYCNSRDMSVQDSFTDPITGYQLDATHLMATANGFMENSDPSDKKESTGGDIAGWGGDIMTFWADWRNAVDEYASPLAFCQAKLAIPGTVSSFGYTDMLEDVDGYLLAKHVAGGGNIVDWMKAHYNNGGGLTRFRSHFDKRWQNATNARACCWDLLAGPSDFTVNAARLALITGAGAALPADFVLLPGNTEKLACSARVSPTASSPSSAWRTAWPPSTRRTWPPTASRPRSGRRPGRTASSCKVVPWPSFSSRFSCPSWPDCGSGAVRCSPARGGAAPPGSPGARCSCCWAPASPTSSAPSPGRRWTRRRHATERARPTTGHTAQRTSRSTRAGSRCTTSVTRATTWCRPG